MNEVSLPRTDNLPAAAARIAPHATVTPVLQERVPDTLAAVQVVMKVLQ